MTEPGVGTNRYSYSYNDPVNLMDPNGNQARDIGMGRPGGVGPSLPGGARTVSQGIAIMNAATELGIYGDNGEVGPPGNNFGGNSVHSESDPSELGEDYESLTQEEQEERQRELEEEAEVEQRTKGKTRHGSKNGGMAQADEDFDSLMPGNVQGIETKYGPGRTGTLKNGGRVTVRPGSSEGPPTLEIRRPNGRGPEIRYPGS